MLYFLIKSNFRPFESQKLNDSKNMVRLKLDQGYGSYDFFKLLISMLLLSRKKNIYFSINTRKKILQSLSIEIRVY
jgi:hypothetical protein